MKHAGCRQELENNFNTMSSSSSYIANVQNMKNKKVQ